MAIQIRGGTGAPPSLAERQLAIDKTTGELYGGLTGSVVKKITRNLLTANLDVYVRTDGSDSNNGLANTSGGAFLTLQKAADFIASLDRSIYNVTCNVADGTYAPSSGVIALDLRGLGPGSGSVSFVGNTTTPANCIISTTSAVAVRVRFGTVINLGGFKLTTATGGTALFVDSNSFVTCNQLMEFGSAAAYQIYSAHGARILFTANYTVSGGAIRHWSATRGAIDVASRAITVTGTPAFSERWATSERLGEIYAAGSSYSGSATGAKYLASGNGIIFTGTDVGSGPDVNFFPGSTAGSAPSGLYL